MYALKLGEEYILVMLVTNQYLLSEIQKVMTHTHKQNINFASLYKCET
jgi:hypothetical protein